MNDKLHSQGAMNIVAGLTVAVAFLMLAAAGLFYWDADTQIDKAIEAAATRSRPAEMAEVRASADASAERLVNALSGTTAGDISVTSDHATGSLSCDPRRHRRRPPARRYRRVVRPPRKSRPSSPSTAACSASTIPRAN